MIYRNILAVFLLLTSLISCSDNNKTTLHDTNGNTLNTAQFKGKWVIINYWAAWCEGCVKEIPELNNFYAHNRNNNVLVFGANYDHIPMPDLAGWVDKERIAYPALVEDPGTVIKLGDIDVLPMTFIIDPHGKLVKSIVGPNTEKSLTDTLHLLQKNDEAAV